MIDVQKEIRIMEGEGTDTGFGIVFGPSPPPYVERWFIQRITISTNVLTVATPIFPGAPNLAIGEWNTNCRVYMGPYGDSRDLAGRLYFIDSTDAGNGDIACYEPILPWQPLTYVHFMWTFEDGITVNPLQFSTHARVEYWAEASSVEPES